MQVNQSPTYQQAREITNLVTKKIFKNYKDAANKRQISYQEASDDLEYMVEIHQLVQIMLERVNSRIFSNNQD